MSTVDCYPIACGKDLKTIGRYGWLLEHFTQEDQKKIQAGKSTSWEINVGIRDGAYAKLKEKNDEARKKMNGALWKDVMRKQEEAKEKAESSDAVLEKKPVPQPPPQPPLQPKPQPKPQPKVTTRSAGSLNDELKAHMAKRGKSCGTLSEDEAPPTPSAAKVSSDPKPKHAVKVKMEPNPVVEESEEDHEDATLSREASDKSKGSDGSAGGSSLSRESSDHNGSHSESEDPTRSDNGGWLKGVYNFVAGGPKKKVVSKGNKALLEENEKLKATIKDLKKTNKRMASTDDHSKQVHELSKDLHNLQTAYDDLHEQHERVCELGRKRIQDLEKELDEALAKVKQGKKSGKVDDLEKQMQALTIDTGKQVQKFSKKLEKRDNEIARLNAENDSLKKALSDVQAENDRLQTEIDSLQQASSASESDSDSDESVVPAKSSGRFSSGSNPFVSAPSAARSSKAVKSEREPAVSAACSLKAVKSERELVYDAPAARSSKAVKLEREPTFSASAVGSSRTQPVDLTRDLMTLVVHSDAKNCAVSRKSQNKHTSALPDDLMRKLTDFTVSAVKRR